MCVCGSIRKIQVGGKTSDMCQVTHTPADIFSNPDAEENESCGYVPYDLGIGGGDYLSLTICLDCHRVQNFPTRTDEQIKALLNGEDIDE